MVPLRSKGFKESWQCYCILLFLPFWEIISGGGFLACRNCRGDAFVCQIFHNQTFRGIGRREQEKMSFASFYACFLCAVECCQGFVCAENGKTVFGMFVLFLLAKNNKNYSGKACYRLDIKYFILARCSFCCVLEKKKVLEIHPSHWSHVGKRKKEKKYQFPPPPHPLPKKILGRTIF